LPLTFLSLSLFLPSFSCFVTSVRRDIDAHKM
jgi:hypothetical protein